MERRAFLRLVGGGLGSLALGSLAACATGNSAEGSSSFPLSLNEPGAVDIGGPRPASGGDIDGAGKYYPEGVLNNNVEVDGECNIWMAGEKLNSRQASGLPVDGNTLAIATWRFNMGSKVIVTSLETGASIVVTVTDRGPNEINYPGQICDITPLVARRLGISRGADIPIRLTPYSNDFTPPPARIQAQSQQSPSGNSSASGNSSGICISKFKPGETRKIGEPPHAGDHTKCVAGPNGEPIWVLIK